MYTMASYASEVMQRLDRYDVARFVDGGLLETLINQARFDVQMFTLQAVPERYARVHRPVAAAVVSWENSARSIRYDTGTGAAVVSINRVGTLALPEDFIIDVAVGVAYSGEMWGCRQVAKRDLHTALTKSFARPTRNDPIYCVERVVGATSPRLLISAGATLPGAGEVEVWYLAKLPWLQISNASGVADTESRIGYDLQELVVLIACMRALETLSLPQAKAFIRQDVEVAIKAIERQYEGQVDRSRLLVQARESNVPNMPIINTAGQGAT